MRNEYSTGTIIPAIEAFSSIDELIRATELFRADPAMKLTLNRHQTQYRQFFDLFRIHDL